MLIAFAIVMFICALGATECCIYQCPRHTNVFDVMVCPLCSIRMFRQEEIDRFVDTFEQGHNGGLFTAEDYESECLSISGANSRRAGV